MVTLKFVHAVAIVAAGAARMLEVIYPVEAAGAAEYARMFLVEVELLVERYKK